MEKSCFYETIENMREKIYNIIDDTETKKEIEERALWVEFHSASEKLSLYYEKKEKIDCWKH